MKKNLFFVGALMMASLSMMAQTKNGGINQTMLQQMEKSQTGGVTNKALFNAIAGNNIDDLVKNHANEAPVDTHFSIETPSQSIHNQKSSGRCWMFSGFNVLRSNFAVNDKQGRVVEFSQDYLFFYDQLEKSNLFLQGVIDTRKEDIDSQMVRWLFQNPLSDGGTYTGVADLVTKYGLVPQDVMPETYVSNLTSEFNGHLKRKLREAGILLREKSQEGASLKQLEAIKVDQLKTVYHMLVMAYGQPPKSFTWAPKKGGKCIGEPQTYTPQEFYKKVCAGTEDLYADYVMLMNDPSRPYHQVYEIDYDRHLYDGHNWLYVNLPMDELKPLAIASLKDSCQMYFSCDVGKFLDRQSGFLDVNNFDYGNLFGTTFGMNKKQRIQSFDSGSSHAMTLMAVDEDAQGKPVKWKVENSWGRSAGADGYLIMTDEWFDEYMFRVVVNRKYCTPQVLELLKKKPVRLPAWDPMFMGEE